MRSTLHRAATATNPPADRLILLPGAYQTATQLLDQGFVRAASRCRTPLDVELVDIDMTHVRDRACLDALYERLVRPARDDGARRIWLCGISLGGFIALLYAAARPGTIDGLCLLAPYLGNRMLLREIESASGIAAWQPGELADGDEERRIWRLVQRRETMLPPVFLGFGRDDRFAQGHRLLADALPPHCVKSVAGGHDWPVWLELWENFLDAGLHDAA